MIVLFVQIAGRFGINPKEAERFSKFLVVGTIGAVVDFGTLTLLIELAGFPTLVANTISFSAAVVSNFTFNRYWTYPDSRNKPITSQLGQFALVSIIGLIINNTILILLEGPFDRLLAVNESLAGYGYLPAKVIATVVVLFWNFFVNRYWTYNDVD
jgi:putative flippase GtrA